MPLRIPEPVKKGLSRALGMSKREREGLLDALSKSVPSVEFDHFIGEAFSDVELPREDVKLIVRTLFSLYSLMDLREFSPESLADEVLASWSDQQASEHTDEAVDGTVTDIRPFIVAAMKMFVPLGLSVKGSRLLTEHERVYRSAEVITDMRPIFEPGKVGARPQGGVVLHTMAITYSQRLDSGLSTFYAALDKADLRELRRTIDRALDKHEAVANMLVDTGAVLLQVPEGEQ